MSPPKILLIPSVLVRGNAGDVALMLCEHCSVIAKILVCCHHIVVKQLPQPRGSPSNSRLNWPNILIAALQLNLRQWGRTTHTLLQLGSTP